MKNHCKLIFGKLLKITLIAGGLFILMSSCDRSEIIAPVKQPAEIVTPEVPIVDNSAKKGVGTSTNTTVGVWWKNIVNLKAHWFYTWGTSIPDAEMMNLPQNVDFVPMFWNGANVNAATIAKMNALYAEGKLKYVLGFNEPDLTAESNMSVSDALDKWQYLCENLDPGIKLVSPATAYPSLTANSWLVQFMDGIAARSLRVDYIAVHIYQPNTVTNFTTPINAVYEKWGKKVWITEFGVRDDNATTVANNKYTPAQMLTFAQALLPEIEKMEAVDRYAWFNAGPDMKGLWPCGLIDANGLPTVLGDYYRSLHPNNQILPSASNQ